MGEQLDNPDNFPVAPTIDWLSRSTQVFTHPDEVLTCPTFTADERRAILASWASDARAVVGFPALRQLESGSVVAVDEVIAALQSLDRVNPIGRPAIGQEPLPDPKG